MAYRTLVTRTIENIYRPGGCSTAATTSASRSSVSSSTAKRIFREPCSRTSIATVGAETGANGRHPLPDRGAFIAGSAAGAQARRPGGVHDGGSGAMAARLCDAALGSHEAVAVLDGASPSG